MNHLSKLNGWCLVLCDVINMCVYGARSTIRLNGVLVAFNTLSVLSHNTNCCCLRRECATNYAQNNIKRGYVRVCVWERDRISIYGWFFFCSIHFFMLCCVVLCCAVLINKYTRHSMTYSFTDKATAKVAFLWFTNPSMSDEEQKNGIWNLISKVRHEYEDRKSGFFAPKTFSLDFIS